MPPVSVRSLAGPAILGLAVWCAACDVSVTSADNATTRLVVPASPLWFLLGMAVGAVVPALRSRALRATPALLSVLPLLPLPLPPIGLLWTGPLAWVPVGVVVVSALWGSRTGRSTLSPRGSGMVGLSAVAAGVATLMTGVFVLRSLEARLPGGDEPHYLIISQSLLQDGDLRIENNHANRDYAAYWGADLRPHFIQRGADGEIYSIHAPGVPVLVAPLFSVFGLVGAQATIMLLAAAGGAFVWLAAWQVTRQMSAAWFAWAAVSGSTTMLVQSVMIFPDGPGAAAVAAAALLLLRLEQNPRVSLTALVATSGLLATLPFLHTRFVLLSVGLGLAIVWRLAKEPVPAVRVRRLALFSVLPVVGAIAWFGYFYVIYGTPDPRIPYGDSDDSRLLYVPGGLLGLLFDQQFGLLTFAPVLASASLGWSRVRSGLTPSIATLGVVALGYLATVCTYWMWWVGVPATPARLATAVVPLLAPFVAVAWRDGGVGRRTVALVLLAASLATSALVLGTADGGLAWAARDAQAAWLWVLGPVVDLPRAWPSFFWNVTGGDVSSEWPFVLHVTTWLAIAVVAGGVASTVTRNRPRASVAGATVLVAFMAAVQAGWWLNGRTGLRPAPSQLTVLQQSSASAGVFAVSTGMVQRVADPLPLVTITVPRVDVVQDSSVVWALLEGLPSGGYEVEFSSPRPAGGVLTVYADAAEPVIVSVPRRSRHVWRLEVPPGATQLRFVPDGDLARSDGGLRLTSARNGPASDYQ